MRGHTLPVPDPPAAPYADRRAYVAALRRSVVSGGHVIIGTFSLAGPTKCSGLDVVRYDEKTLQRELGDGFELDACLETTHLTPGGKEQHFVLCRFRNVARSR